MRDGLIKISFALRFTHQKGLRGKQFGGRLAFADVDKACLDHDEVRLR